MTIAATNPLSNILPAALRSTIGAAIPALDGSDVEVTGISVIRHDANGGDELFKVAAAGGGSVMGGMLTGGAGLTADVKFNAEALSGYAQLKAEAGVNSELTPPLTSFLGTLVAAQAGLGAIKSNVDPADFNDPEKALALITSLKKDEFLIGAYLLDGKELYYRGTDKGAAQPLADILKGANALTK